MAMSAYEGNADVPRLAADVESGPKRNTTTATGALGDLTATDCQIVLV